MKTLINHKGMAVGLVKGGREREQVIQFINAKLFQKYNNSPDPESTPETLLAVWQEQEIVAALALEFGEDGLLPYEGIYSFDTKSLPFAFNRDNVAYYCRLTADNHVATRPLVYVATKHALDKGKQFAVSVVKPSVARFISLLGIEIIEVKAELVIENIPGADRKYYLAIPVPRLYAMSLNQIIQAVSPKTWE